MHQEADKHIPKCLGSSLYTTDQKINRGGQRSHDFVYNLVFKLVHLLYIHYTTPQICYNRADISRRIPLQRPLELSAFSISLYV